MTLFILIIVGFFVWRAYQKHLEKEEFKVWLEHKRLSDERAEQSGKAIDPVHKPPQLASVVHAPLPAKPDWKVQLAMAGAKMVLCAFLGHRPHNNHNQRHDS